MKWIGEEGDGGELLVRVKKIQLQQKQALN